METDRRSNVQRRNSNHASDRDLVTARSAHNRGDVIVARRLPRRLVFFVLAAAQQVLRQRNKALKIALQFAAIFHRLFQLVEKIGRTEVAAPSRAVAETDKLLMRDVWQ